MLDVEEMHEAKHLHKKLCKSTARAATDVTTFKGPANSYQHGSARLGSARLGLAWLGLAQHDTTLRNETLPFRELHYANDESTAKFKSFNEVHLGRHTARIRVARASDHFFMTTRRDAREFMKISRTTGVTASVISNNPWILAECRVILHKFNKSPMITTVSSMYECID